MQPTRESGFSRARLTQDEDRRQPGLETLVCCDYLLQVRFDCRKCLSKDEIVPIAAAAPVFSQASFLFCASGPRDHQGQLRRIKWLDQVVQRPKSHGLDGASHTAVGCHDNHARALGKGAFAQEVCANAIRHLYVEQSVVVARAFDRGARRGQRANAGYVHAQCLEVGHELLAEQQFIFDDEYTQTFETGITHAQLVTRPNPPDDPKVRLALCAATSRRLNGVRRRCGLTACPRRLRKSNSVSLALRARIVAMRYSNSYLGLWASVFAGAWLFLSQGLLAAQDSAGQTNIIWTDIRALGVEGQGWRETKAPFDRLPAKAEGKVREAVWNLSRNSAGMHVRFVTDARTIHARWTLTSSHLAMPHMAATGVSGLDLYVKTGSDQWRWLAVGIPRSQTNDITLTKDLPPGRREYLLYLPLYNGTSSVEIGVPCEAALMQAGMWGKGSRKPIVFYGTSILHGACASRPGMVHSAILGRMFNWPTINLGFSGNGRMEPELGDLLAELDPAVYVLDCLPNMTADQVSERVEPFVQKLRAAHPRTPIVLVEDRNYADAFLVASKRVRNETSQAALRAAFKRLKNAGVKNIHYIPAKNLLGDDGDGTVDSSHPNDLGFARQANMFAKVLRPLLRRAAAGR